MKKRSILFIICVFILVITGCKNKEENISEKKVEYVETCEEGYELVDNSCRKIEDVKEKQISYFCDDEDKLEGKNCKHKVTAEKFDVKKCNNGYVLENGSCIKKESINAKVSYSCSSGKLKGNKCVQTVADPKSVVCEKYCLSSEYDPSVGKCKSVAPYTGRITYTKPVCKYSCTRGELIGGMCYLDVATNAIAKYSCAAGYTSTGTKCTRTLTVAPTIVKQCPNGYKEENNNCIKYELSNAKEKDYCEEGYELKDNECIKYEYKEIIKKEKN